MRGEVWPFAVRQTQRTPGSRTFRNAEYLRPPNDVVSAEADRDRRRNPIGAAWVEATLGSRRWLTRIDSGTCISFLPDWL